MSMADMHDFSERRYFIAHRSFSDLMETWIGEGLVTYDPETGAVGGHRCRPRLRGSEPQVGHAEQD